METEKEGKRLIVLIIAIISVLIISYSIIANKKYRTLQAEVLTALGFASWDIVSYFDEYISVKSRQTLEKYDEIKFFKENRENLAQAQQIIKTKTRVTTILNNFLKDNDFKSCPQYKRLIKQINTVLINAEAYRIRVRYTSPAGKIVITKEIALQQRDINRFKKDPTLLMTKGEYSKLLKEQQKEALRQKHSEYYDRVNKLIDYASANRDSFIAKESQVQLDNLIAQLFDRTVNSIKKIKTLDSEEWETIGDFIIHIKNEIETLVNKNNQILQYYESSDFLKIKETCEVLMSTQREFNEYIEEKIQTVAQLFGTRVVRNETIHEDEYNYIRPYRKTITPFTAEVSATVFASAENSPLDYVIKIFYPDKKSYPDQIQKLYSLVEELETLKEAKQIIENYKQEYRQYLGDVPDFIMQNDEAGFYSRLGFAIINESVLTVEYKFVYTSGGGFAQRSFTIPMTEETIAALIKALEGKLTASAFAKAQRTLMTKKLRDFIKSRDNFTCCNCGNSTHKEPNLLLEIDHIIPVAKGGCTVETNLQTLCWKCNRAKGDKILSQIQN